MSYVNFKIEKLYAVAILNFGKANKGFMGFFFFLISSGSLGSLCKNSALTLKSPYCGDIKEPSGTTVVDNPLRSKFLIIL